MGGAVNSEGDQFAARVETLSWGLLGGMGAASSLALSPAAAGGILLGGIICILNFKFLVKSVEDGLGGRLRLRGFFRFFAVLAAIALTLKFGLADPIYMLIGLSLVPLSIVVMGLLTAK